MASIIFTVIIIVSALVFVWSRFSDSSHSNEAPRSCFARNVRNNEAVLLRMCHGDKEMLNRLIELERECNPNISRGQATKNAVDTYHRHNR